jgi:hypothetical protein
MTWSMPASRRGAAEIDRARGRALEEGVHVGSAGRLSGR